MTPLNAKAAEQTAAGFADQGGGGQPLPRTDGQPHNSTTSPKMSNPNFSLSPEAHARLQNLAYRVGLSPEQALDALVLAADAQLLAVAARMTPGAVASGWRPRRFIPMRFVVVGEEA